MQLKTMPGPIGSMLSEIFFIDVVYSILRKTCYFFVAILTLNNNIDINILIISGDFMDDQAKYCRNSLIKTQKKL